MSDRPVILPGVLADVISSVPSRLQRKLDKNPDAAGGWSWAQASGEWKIAAGK